MLIGSAILHDPVPIYGNAYYKIKISLSEGATNGPREGQRVSAHKRVEDSGTSESVTRSGDRAIRFSKIKGGDVICGYYKLCAIKIK
jgi:hypothetical protein